MKVHQRTHYLTAKLAWKPKATVGDFKSLLAQVKEQKIEEAEFLLWVYEAEQGDEKNIIKIRLEIQDQHGSLIRQDEAIQSFKQKLAQLLSDNFRIVDVSDGV